MEPVETKQMRWFVGVPVGTNPLIVIDVLFILAIVWVASIVFIMAGQQFLGEGLTRETIRAAAALGSYLALMGWCVFLFVGFFLFSNRYAVLYRLEKNGAFCEQMQGTIRPVTPGFLRRRPYAIEPLLNPSRSRSQQLDWSEVSSLQCIASMQVLVLKGKRGTLMKIYCPDMSQYGAVAEFVKQRIAERG